MHDDEVEALKNKKLKEIQKQQQELLNGQIEFQQKLVQLENLAKQFLTKEATSRYFNLKVAHPEIAVKAISIIAQAVQTGQIKEKITDQQFRNLLIQIQEKKDFRIIK